MNLPIPPQMPDVIYVVSFDGDPQSMAFLENDGLDTSYTRTDLCEELKVSLSDCVTGLIAAQFRYRRERGSNLTEVTGMVTPYDEVLTKAQGLLQ